MAFYDIPAAAPENLEKVLSADLNRRAFLGVALFLLSRPAVAQRRPPSRAARLIAAARAQVGITLLYDPAYASLAFPNGDVDRARGVCTDVVIRAYRDGLALDLQALVNSDMRANFATYPKTWG